MSNPSDAIEDRSLDVPSLCGKAVMEAWDFSAQSVMHMDKRGKQAEVIAHGLVVGGIKDIPNELLNHPWETAGKASAIGMVSACLGAALSAKTKWIATTAKFLGWGLGSTALATTAIDLASKPKLQAALSNIWQSDDKQTMVASKVVAEGECGPTGFDFGLALPAAVAGGIGGRMAFKRWELTRPVPPNLLKSDLVLHASDIKTSIKKFVPNAAKDEVAMLDEFVGRAKLLTDNFAIKRISSYDLGRTPALNVEFEIPGYRRGYVDDPVTEAIISDISALANEITFKTFPGTRLFNAHHWDVGD